MSGKDDLRRRAEEVFQAQAALTPQDVAAQSPEAIQRALHELSVHQIELEMQNEELRRTQIELQESQSRYLNLFDLAPVGYFTLNDEGLILEANLTSVQLLGSSRNEFKLHPISRYILYEDQYTYYQKRKLLVHSGLQQACDLRMVTRDKALFWGHLEMTAAQDVDGLPIYRVILSDITERKRSEEALRKSEEKLGSIYQAIPVPTYTWQANDGDFILIDFNQAARDITRGRITEMMGIRASRLYHDHPDIIKNLSDCYLTHTSSMRELKYLFQTTGETKLLYIKFVFVAPDLVLVHTEDITERKQAEDALRESEERLEIIFRMSPAALAITSLSDYQFVSVNDAWQNLTGYTSAEAVGHTSEHLNLWVRPTPYDAIIQMIRDQGVARSETQIRCKDGQIHNLLMSAEIVNLSGQLTLLTTALDITERKQAEEALRESEERFRKLFEGRAAVNLVIDPATGDIVDANAAAVSFYGWTIAQLKQMRIYQINIAPQSDVKQLMETVVSSQRFKFEFRHRLADGSIRDVETFSSKVEIAGKSLLYSIIHDITERKQAEEALRQAHERLTLTQRSAGAGLWDWDMVTGALDWSPELFQLFGLDPKTSDATFDVWQQVMHPDDWQMASDGLSAAIRDHRSLVNDYRIITPSGQVRWITALGSAEYASTGEPLRMSGICLDFTERKRTEAMLVESENRLRTVARLSSDFAFSCVRDRDGKYTIDWITDTFYALTGMTEAELRQAGCWMTLAHPDDSALATEPLDRLQPGDRDTREFRILAKDGRILYIINHLECESDLRAAGGRRMVGAVRDITERKLAEVAMRASEDKFRSLFEQSQDGIEITNVNDGFLDVNDAFCRMLGYSREELLQMKVSDVIAPEMRGEPGTVIQSELARDGSTFISVDLHRDGRRIPVEVTTTRLEGTRLAFSIVRDITERKLAEEALLKRNADLERFNNITVNREIRMIALKQEINALLRAQGLQDKYHIVKTSM